MHADQREIDRWKEATLRHCVLSPKMPQNALENPESRALSLEFRALVRLLKQSPGPPLAQLARPKITGRKAMRRGGTLRRQDTLRRGRVLRCLAKWATIPVMLKLGFERRGPLGLPQVD